MNQDLFYAFVETYMYNNLKTTYSSFMKNPLFREMAQLYPVSAKAEEFKRLRTLRNFGNEK